MLILLAAAACWAAPSSRLLENGAGQNAAYTGIGRLVLGSNCTAFLIRTPGSGPAYALSAGHCYSLDSQSVFVDRALPPSTRPVQFNFFADTAGASVAVPIRRLAYSTMKGTDIAVLELAATQAELASRGVRALELESGEPAAGEAIEVVGAPSSFFEPREWFLRRATCTLGGRADLIEFTWHFWDTRRNDCEDIVGGMSGSPVILARTGHVSGVVNTTTHLAFARGGDFDCYAGRPCELGAGGQRVEEETSYSISLAGLMECFRPSGEFDLLRPACPLDRGNQLAVSQRTRNHRRGGRLGANLAGGLAYYRYKLVVAGAGDCRQEIGYSAPHPLAERPLIDDPLPEEENRYLLCVVAGDSAADGARWQEARHASVLIVRVDATPPVRPPGYTVLDNPASFRIAFEFAPPELSGYDYKLGPVTGTRCEESGYRPYLRIPVSIPKTSLPQRICFYAYDEANNTSPALSLTIGAGPVILPGGVTHAAGFQALGLAPGQWISPFGLDLKGSTPILRDAQGVDHRLTVAYESDQQMNARLPAAAALGDGFILVGDHSEPVRLVPASPGIFLVSSGAGELTAYTTGLNGIAASRLRAAIGRLAVPVLSVEPLDSGIEIVRLKLPGGHGLAGRQFLQIQTGDGLASNRRDFVLRERME